ncbi:MAG: hypothetical protein ACRDHL_15775 [Candidatus Promineifilaceae bacterium]
MALTRLLKRLRAGCQKLGEINDWYDLAYHTDEAVGAYQDLIAPERQRAIQWAIELPQATLAGGQPSVPRLAAGN